MKRNQTYRIAAIAFLLQLTALLASAQTEPVVAYVTIKTYNGTVIKGTSALKGHEDAIECVGFSYTMKTTLNIGSQSTGAGAGKMQPVTIQLIKHVDAASPTLMQMMMNGQAMQSLTIEVIRKGGDMTTDIQKIEFDLVSISQITEYAGAGSDKSNTIPDEQLTLEASKISITSPTQSANGAVKVTPAATYDIKANKRQ